MPKTRSHPTRSPAWRVIIRTASAAMLAIASAQSATGQLAITEVLSAPSPNGLNRDDFWELTNFGTNTIDLSSYWFRDSGGFAGAANLATLWAGTRTDLPLIGTNESIIFAKAPITPANFRLWWGESQVSPNLKIVTYTGYGFSATADAVQLWQATAERTNLVQRVELLQSLPGQTFTYDSTTGLLDVSSIANVNGAFVAADASDIGSPGVTIGPVPLILETAPIGTNADGGSLVTLAVRARGLPPPHYQWRFNDNPIPGATAETLIIEAAQSEDAGQYSVEVSNGLEKLVTPPVLVTINTTPSCAKIVHPLADLEVTPNQTASFTVETRGYPPPTFQWQFNGVDVAGATGRTFSVTAVDESSWGLYTVHVANPLCATNASARLRVVPKANLLITEAMTSPTNSFGTGHNSWWELTNLGTNAVNLHGYRWDDDPPSLESPVVVTNDVVLPPGRSAIFLSEMTPDTFRRWWGEENLPPDLPIVSHPGNGLSRQRRETVTLWNPTARLEEDHLFAYGVKDQSLPPTEGTSLRCDPDFADCGDPSVEGQDGAFRAAEGGDIGSPGWTSNEQRAVPRYVSIRRDAAGYSLRWKTEPGRTYSVQWCDDLGHPAWRNLTNLPANGPWLSSADTALASRRQRFYRVLLQPSAP